MYYRLPTSGDEELLRNYIGEHHRNGETSVSASDGLPTMSYSDWLVQTYQRAETGNGPWGTSLCLLCFEEERLVGLLSVRYELKGELATRLGHIGYSVRPCERNKGYATRMLGHGLEICREHGLSEVILGCYRDNVGSMKTILNCGGRLIEESDRYKPGRMSLYYKIDL